MRKLLVIGAIALLAASRQSPALAGKIYPAWVIPDTVNVRSGPGTDRKLISHLSKGTKVYVTAFANNWCWAKLPTGKWGWISEPLLQFSAEKGRALAGSTASASSSDVDAMPAWIKVATVNVRSGPGTNYQQRGQLAKGDKVYVVEIRNDWRKCRTPGGYGWIRHDMLETNVARGQRLAAAGGSTPATSSGSSSNSGGTAKAYVTGDRVHLRSGPGTNYRIKASVVKGQTLYITETRGDWRKVTVHGGDTGWIHSDLIKYEGGSGPSSGSSAGGTAKGYVRADAVHLRSGPGTNYRIKAKVVEGQTLYITETRGDWYEVTVHGGESGWIRSDLVKLEKDSSPNAGSSGSTSRPPPPTTPPATTSGSGGTLEGVNAWIGEDAVNVRYGPGTDQDVKTKLSKGAKVQVLELSGHWCKIKTEGGTVGWVAGWVMNFKGPGQDVIVKQDGEEIAVRAGWVARPEVNLRAGPGTDEKEIGEATLGTQVIILDKQGDWYKVALDNGATGWMASWLVDTREERRARQGIDGDGGSIPAAIIPASSVGRKAVDLAMNYLGCRYVHGTSGPRTFDCSGFTSFIYRQLGINISRSSRTQAYQGDLVPRNQLQIGDVIVFKNTYRSGPSHVGLYIGNDKFIHASNSRRGVVTDSLHSSYYAPRYHSARRVY
jgi:uncharacterized protein YgiM (DUF1202 family)